MPDTSLCVALCSTGMGYITLTARQFSKLGNRYPLDSLPAVQTFVDGLIQSHRGEYPTVGIYDDNHRCLSSTFDTLGYCVGQLRVDMLLWDGIIVWTRPEQEFLTRWIGQTCRFPTDTYFEHSLTVEAILMNMDSSAVYD